MMPLSSLPPQELALYAALALAVTTTAHRPISRIWTRFALWKNGNCWATCFNCNEELIVPLHVLAPGNCFKCSLCDSINYFDQAGGPQLHVVQDITHEDPLSYTMPSMSRQSSFQSQTTLQGTVFCRKCIQNQNILVQLLAAYDPEDDEYFDLSVEAYRKKLEAKYPPVCSSCEPAVNNRLADLARMVKSRIASASVLLHKGLPVPPHAQYAAGPDNKGRNSKFSITYFIVWAVLVFSALAIHMFTISFYTRGLMYPASYHPGYIPHHCTIPEGGARRFAALYNFISVMPTRPCDSCCAQDTLSSLLVLSLLSFVAIPFNPLWLFKLRYQKSETKNQLPYLGLISTYTIVRIKEKSAIKLNYDTQNTSNMTRSDSGYVDEMAVDDVDDSHLGLEHALALSHVRDTSDRSMALFLQERSDFEKWRRRIWNLYVCAIGVRCVTMMGFDVLYLVLVGALCIAIETCRQSLATFPEAAKGTSQSRMISASIFLIVRLILVIPPLLLPTSYPTLSSTYLSTTRSLYWIIPDMKGTELLGAFDIALSAWTVCFGIALDVVWMTSAVVLGMGIDLGGYAE
ncbi:hypothetical protein SmJEL517_g00976 [Synchytrium microbalum]|uniref:Ima1 N-terminal domain-containing protein n=1 Tax=Synchytrium microbalum TaxID=1806994 RepID=A0A507CH21_9FUNG|nr:uncharacterized protein SmJEL517_g00976 [Synchytrium microbalum]TPX36945.1 hypothetical protein SmJEL517_g00976 [Synchytrium microbalum]